MPIHSMPSESSRFNSGESDASILRTTGAWLFAASSHGRNSVISKAQVRVTPAAQLVTACLPRMFFRVIAHSHKGVNSTATAIGIGSISGT
ncbi:Uncharacterised protein [Neisseria meningitidis]|nr:Uncharacterised protein [Neisseria meningitidis]